MTGPDTDAGEGNGPDPAPFGLTILDALRAAAELGYQRQLTVDDDGRVADQSRGDTWPGGEVRARYEWRVEGTSDAADQTLVLAVEPPDGDPGVLVLTYGPRATEADTAALESLDLGPAEPGPTPDEPPTSH